MDKKFNFLNYIITIFLMKIDCFVENLIGNKIKYYKNKAILT